MTDQIIQLGLIKLAIIAVVGFVFSFCKAAWESSAWHDRLLIRRAQKAAQNPVDEGWTTIVEEPAHHRAWKRLTGRRGSTSIEVRQDRRRVE